MLKGIIKCVLAACTFSTGLFGQDLNQDIGKIVDGLDSTSGVSIEASIKARGRKGGEIIYSAGASIYRNATASFTRLGEQEFLVTKEFDVHVDHEEKALLVLKKDKSNPKKPKKQQLNMDVSALKKLAEGENGIKPKTLLLSNLSGVKTYSITNIQGIKEVRIVLDMNKLSIQSVSYEYSEGGEYKGQFVTIDYTEFKRNTDVTAKLQTSRFFTGSEGKYVPAARLKTYRIYTEL